MASRHTIAASPGLAESISRLRSATRFGPRAIAQTDVLNSLGGIVLPLEAIRPALLCLRDDCDAWHDYADSPEDCNCAWCNLPQAWRDWAEAGP